MSRRDIFNDAAARINQQHGLNLNLYVDGIEDQLALAEDEFTYQSDEVALPLMLQAFQGVVATGIAAMRDHGAYSRDSGQKLGTDDAAAFQALDEERKYQDSKVTPGYVEQMTPAYVAANPPKPYTANEEITMMRSYLRNDVRKALSAGDTEKAAKGIRKVAAMALRGIENPKL
jgi:hypothetical protein